MLAFFLFLAYGLRYQRYFGWYYADCYVTTLLSFSFLKYGFMRRGLAGTLYDIVCRIIPSAMSYKGAVWFMWGMNVIYFASLLLFAYYVLSRIKDEKVYRGAYFFMLLCFAFFVPTVCTGIGALGRADLFQIVICVLQIYFIIEMKHEWLTVPLSAVNTLFHEGYVLMTFCAVLIVLIYRAVNTEGKKAKYWLLFGLNVAVVGIVAALSITVGSRNGTPEGYRAALSTAEELNIYRYVHYNLLNSMAKYAPENAAVINDADYVAAGLRELPLFLVCFIPAFIVFGRGLVNLFRQSKGERVGLHIAAVLLGPVLIGVEYLKYCDYGRYILWLVFYFFTVFTAFTVMDDNGAKKSLSVSFGYKNITAILIIALMMIYQPLPTTSFTGISRQLALVLYH